MEYDNEENGDGVVIFKPCKTLKLKSGKSKSIKRPAPKDWMSCLNGIHQEEVF